MVIEAEPDFVLGSSGPKLQDPYRRHGDDEPAHHPADDLRRVTMRVPGVRGGRCMTPGVGHVDDEADHDRNDDEELAEEQLEREQRDAAVDVEDRREQHQLEHRRQDRQLELHVRRDAPVDVPAEVDRPHEGREVVIGEDDLRRLLVTSEPLPIATPTSACLSAAASFTASPVMATTSPASCMSRARRSLSSGATRPKRAARGAAP